MPFKPNREQTKKLDSFLINETAPERFDSYYKDFVQKSKQVIKSKQIASPRSKKAHLKSQAEFGKGSISRNSDFGIKGGYSTS